MTILEQDPGERFAQNGFLLIPMPDGTRRQVDLAFQSARDFFSASKEEKLQSRLPFDCGYRPSGVEYSSSSNVPDAIESFTASMRTRNDGRKLETTRSFELHERLITTFESLERLAEALVLELATRISGTDYSNRLRGSLHRWSRLQLNYALPAQSTPEYINDVHEDGHLLTIVCSTAPGLELRTQEGHFACPRAASGDFVIMPGNIAWLLSGGRIKPLYHRVRRIAHQQERMSLLFFADICPQNCTPWVHTEINAGADIGASVLTNYSRFGLRGFPLE
jgi:isopenicillin N synthase-like dioxygenase